MKKSLLSIYLLTFIVLAANAQKTWITKKINDKVSIKFPSEPKEVNPGSFVATTEDKGTACIFSTIDPASFGLDSASFASISKTEDFTKNYKNGIKQSLPDFDLTDIKIGNWNNLTSYTLNGVNPQGRKIDYFIFVMNNKIYIMVTRRAAGINTTDMNTYFASVELKH
jgi:hypothetical protein